MPLMLALPDTGSLNVTMALPFAQTSFATLLRSIVALQMRMRKRRGDFTFFYADVLEVLSHPHIALIAADQAAALRDHINRKALYNIDAGTLDRFAPALSFIFNPVSDPDSSGPVYDYLRGLLDGLYTALRARSTVQAAEESFELQSLTALSDKLSRLRDLMDIYKVDVSEGTVMMMFERLLTSGMLTMSGTPLRGLQVMGALETRLLDFDNVIFLSLNERVFPQRNVLKTMIPANLRRGYGLSPIDREENSLNYYFYRLLSRAAHAWLLYDSRPAALGGGEPSRYLSQLVYGPLARCEGVEVTSALADMQTEAPPRREITVSKTPEVLAELARYFDSGSDRNLSASGLKEYMKCPLSFYLKYVRGYRSDDEPADYINAAQAGDILHHTMQALYGRYTGQVIDAGVIDGILAGDDIRRLLLEEYYRLRPSERGLPLERLQPEGIIVLSQIELQIRQMLQIERGQYAPFVYVGGETDRAHVHEQWQITPSLRVNFKMSIDRIDASVDGASLRFVDYKTGADKTGLGSKFENMFSGDHYYQAIFQLLLYREAWRDLRGFRGPIEPVIHSMHSIMRENRIVPLTYNAAPITAQPELYAEFRTRLEQIVTAIFDSDTPFCQASDIDRCRFCEFATMCNRQAPPEKEY